MSGATTSIKGFFADLPTPILPNIGGEPTIERLVDLHRLVSGNAASVSSNLGGGWHIHLVLKITNKDYISQTGFAIFPPHNPGVYPPTMGNAQDQALRTENFRQNQALFLKYTAVDGDLKKEIIAAVEPVFLSPLVYQLTGFGQVSALTIL